MAGQSPVGVWALTGYTSQNNTTYFSNLDADLAVAQRVADDFAPRPAGTPAMSVVVDAGFIGETLPNGLQSVIEVAQQTVTISAAPSSPNNRIDLVVIDAGTGTASVIAGTAATSPSAPAITAGKKQVAQVSVPNGTASIINSNITDLRSVWQSGIPGVKWGVASGTADAITLATTPATASLVDGMRIWFRATAANATATPSFNLDGLGAKTITKQGGAALAAGDIPGALAACLLEYNLVNTRWELLNPAATGFSTGDVKTTLKTTADPGWVMMNDGTIGDASSGASARANSDTQALFMLLWNNVSDTNCPMPGGRGASAAADWATHHQITLPKMLGRALASAGAGSGLTSRALAAILGEETHTLTPTEMPSHTHTTDAVTAGSSSYNTGSGSTFLDEKIITSSSAGSDGPHNNMQPTIFLNFMIKL